LRAVSFSRPRSELKALVGLVALAALLRFGTLDVQSFSNDEPFTVEIAGGRLSEVLSSVRTKESTPPLYPYLAWAWEKAFGTGETGMRLLPALLGTLLVPVTWAAARVTLPSRSALIAAALVTFSPLLVWYSQEARAYALFALLATLGFLFFVRALRAPPGPSVSRDLAIWSLLSATALLTHYFAVFAIGAQALWLLLARADLRGRVALAALVPIATGAALLSLLRYQEEHVPRAWTESFTLWDQLRGSAQELAVGLRWTWLVQRPGVLAILGVGGAALVLLAWRGSRVERAGALPAGVVALAVLIGPVAVSLLGDNLVASRNVIAAWPLAAIVAGAGLGAAGAWRIGAALAVALFAVMLSVDVAVPLDERLQRDDWEELMAAAGPPAPPGAVAVLRGFENSRVAAYYLPGGGQAPRAETVSVRRLLVVGDPNSMTAFLRAASGAGFAVVGREENGRLTLARLRSPSRTVLPANAVFGLADLIVRSSDQRVSSSPPPAAASEPASDPSSRSRSSARSRSRWSSQSRIAPSMNHSHARAAERSLGGGSAPTPKPSRMRAEVRSRTWVISSPTSGTPPALSISLR
jgi:4-amino-4-deoxy-L-arabinose transferase-like glycosyltransferase